MTNTICGYPTTPAGSFSVIKQDVSSPIAKRSLPWSCTECYLATGRREGVFFARKISTGVSLSPRGGDRWIRWRGWWKKGMDIALLIRRVRRGLVALASYFDTLALFLK